MKGLSMRTFLFVCCCWGVGAGGGVFYLQGSRKTKNIYIHFGSYSENITIIKQIGSKTKMWDVGCDRMVFAINSDPFLIKIHPTFNKWSLDQGQKTINPLIPYYFPYSTLGGALGPIWRRFT